MNGPKLGTQGTTKRSLPVTEHYDVHTVLSKLLLKAEKSPDSLERMLAVTRLYLTFLTQIMKPGKKFQDTPTVILGQHYLSHREMHGEFHRGDQTRSYLQEICSYDPVEAPIAPPVYKKEGHVDVGTWRVHMMPSSHVKVKKEGLIGTPQVYVEVSMDGTGRVRYPRHDEEYTFNFPSLLLVSPLSEHCAMDLEGNVSIMCQATGLKTDLRFKPWRDEYVKGEVSSLLGDGTKTEARIEGNWDNTVSVYSLTSDATGVLFAAADDPPPVLAPPVINLSKPGPQTMFRLWSGILESLLYMDSTVASGAAQKKATEMIAAMPHFLKDSLMYSVPVNPQGKSATASGGDANDPTSQLAAALDRRPLPPICKIQRAMGRTLAYQLKYTVQSISHDALGKEAEFVAKLTGQQE